MKWLYFVLSMALVVAFVPLVSWILSAISLALGDDCELCGKRVPIGLWTSRYCEECGSRVWYG